tara:strand:- start:40 stop:393 length:354 start_codon:yes stop_codon:yes gene_type:complete
MNSLSIVGNLASDPELKKVNETSVLNFTVASNVNKDTVIYSDCALWGKLGESLSTFLTKGKPVTVFGELSGINAYVKKDGDANATIRIKVNSLKMHGTNNNQDAAPSSVEPNDDIPF